jgi:hypothetical protein
LVRRSVILPAASLCGARRYQRFIFRHTTSSFDISSVLGIGPHIEKDISFAADRRPSAYGASRKVRDHTPINHDLH